MTDRIPSSSKPKISPNSFKLLSTGIWPQQVETVTKARIGKKPGFEPIPALCPGLKWDRWLLHTLIPVCCRLPFSPEAKPMYPALELTCTVSLQDYELETLL